MLGDLLRRTAQRAPDAVAFVHGDRRLTYAEWDWLSDRAAYSLSAEGLRRGDVVALLLQPGFDYPIAYLGATKIGCVAAGINPRLARPEIEHILDDARARALVTDDERFASEPLLFSPPDLNRPGGDPDRPDIAATDPAAIAYTSGTTGAPKGATFTHAALDAVRRIEGAREPPEARGVQAIPMAHVGFMTKIASFIDRTGSSVLLARWSPAGVLAAIERERLTSIGGIPTQLELMLRDPSFGRTDLSSLRRVTIGGAPAAAWQVHRLREEFGVPVVQRYSCTELALCTATDPEDPDDVVADTVGRPLPEVDLRIDAPDADGVGGIVARSPAMMRGYWPTLQGLDAHGYFHTGDLGSLDAAGNLRLAGRAKEMYIRGGYNVYPLEVENILMLHPKVSAAAVVGVPDEVLGERGRALVVPADPADPPTAEELKVFAAEQLAAHKLPEFWEIRTTLPMTSMFKVDKRALAEEFAPVDEE